MDRTSFTVLGIGEVCNVGDTGYAIRFDKDPIYENMFILGVYLPEVADPVDELLEQTYGKKAEDNRRERIDAADIKLMAYLDDEVTPSVYIVSGIACYSDMRSRDFMIKLLHVVNRIGHTENEKCHGDSDSLRFYWDTILAIINKRK